MPFSKLRESIAGTQKNARVLRKTMGKNPDTALPTTWTVTEVLQYTTQHYQKT